MIGIIDYRMGNLRSVQKAFEQLGSTARILSSPDQIDDIRRLVLPGVGAFADGMHHLEQDGWDQAIKAFIATGKPFLGICMGMQLLFDDSQEDAPAPDKRVAGLSILPGNIVRFQCDKTPARLNVPHMGWNSLQFSRPDPLLKGLPQDIAVYFVHSYYARPTDLACVSASCDYGGVFCASIWKDNIWATQFHPEKSQKVGLKMLANFAAV